MFPNHDAHSELKRGRVVRETVLELVGQTLVRFRAEVGRMAMAFVWGTLFGWFLSVKPPTREEQFYERASTRANEIITSQGRSKSTGYPNIQVNDVLATGTR